MTRYITLPLKQDPEVLVRNIHTALRAVFPGWTPNDGNLDTWMIESFSGQASDLAYLASAVPDTIFRYFGNSLMDIPPGEATSAITTTTWTAIDNSGYRIEIGTQVGIPNENGEMIPFVTLNEVIIPPGSTVTAAGAVTIVALLAGSDGSGLGGIGAPVELIDPLSWVASITMTDITVGGVDAELDSAYLDRLRGELQLMSPRPILPYDFSVLARENPAVWRATAVDGYNPADGTIDNERMVAVALMDSTGQPASAQVKSDVKAMLEEMREVNFIVNVIDPAYVIIDVTYTVRLLRGVDEVATIATIDGELADYLDPAKWGLPEDKDPRIWVNDSVVRYLEIASVINAVAGVDFISALFIGVHGTALAAADVPLTGGPVVLPEVGDINGVSV